MKTALKIFKSNKFLIASIAFIFAIMLSANILTPLVADDFGYCFSFKTGERIVNVFDIIPSMAAHRQLVNGRIIAHALVQFMLIMPKWVFNIINSAVFVAVVCLILFLSGISGDKNKALSSLIIFSLIWIFQPAFGQVNLWLDGSCNYLWAELILLLFFVPYYKLFFNKEAAKKLWHKIIFVLFGFAVGAYSENGSAAIIMISTVILLYKAIKREKSPIYLWISLIAASAGLCSIILVPATTTNDRFNLNIINGIIGCISIFSDYSIIFAISFVILVYLIMTKRKDDVILPIILVAGSFVSLFLLAAVRIQSSRRGYFSMILVLISLMLIANKVKPQINKKISVAFTVIIFAIFTIFAVYGFKDIHELYKINKSNEEIILQAKEKNNNTAEINAYTGNTKYSANNGLNYYFDSISNYYGIDVTEQKTGQFK